MNESSMTSDLCAAISHRWTDYLESTTDETDLNQKSPVWLHVLGTGVKYTMECLNPVLQ